MPWSRENLPLTGFDFPIYGFHKISPLMRHLHRTFRLKRLVSVNKLSRRINAHHSSNLVVAL